MATPLSPFSNARLLAYSPGSRGGPENGYRLLPGSPFLLTCFLKQVTPRERADFLAKTSLDVATDIYSGYLTGFVALGDEADFTTYDFGSDPSYDDSGVRPEWLRPSSDLQLSLGGRLSTSTKLLSASSVFGDLGIGSTIREIIGDRLVISVEWYG